MKTVYKPKIGLELVLPLFTLLAFLALKKGNETSWADGVIPLLLFLVILYLFSTTNYTIKDTVLYVKCGILYQQNIDITTITKISETNNLQSSPAPSLDRIEICFNKFDSVLVSPKDKMGFINHLLRCNPAIVVTYKAAK